MGKAPTVRQSQYCKSGFGCNMASAYQALSACLSSCRALFSYRRLAPGGHNDARLRLSCYFEFSNCSLRAVLWTLLARADTVQTGINC